MKFLNYLLNYRHVNLLIFNEILINYSALTNLQNIILHDN